MRVKDAKRSLSVSDRFKRTDAKLLDINVGTEDTTEGEGGTELDALALVLAALAE